MVAKPPKRIETGQRWRDRDDSLQRTIIILSPMVYDTGPSWRYEDEPDGWHYCDILDFCMWNRFEYLGE